MQRGPIHHFSVSAIVSNPLKNSDKAQEIIFHDFILKMTKDVGVVKNAAIHLLLGRLSQWEGYRTKHISSLWPLPLNSPQNWFSSCEQKENMER